MNVLIIGGGGREHALAWKSAQSTEVEKIYVAPGNAGTALEDKVENVPLAPSDTEGLVEFARARAVALTIVGPEAPLVAGITDAFEKDGAALLRSLRAGCHAGRFEELQQGLHAPARYSDCRL